MPTYPAEQLRHLAAAILAAAGTPDDIARRVALSLVASDLKGVESHGVMRLEWYLEQIRDGVIRPAARPSLQMDKPNSALLAGSGAFGIHGMEIAADLAIAKARTGQVAAVALTDVGHTGRLGQFAEQIAEAGMFAMILGGGNHQRWGCVAPFGGSKALLPTNPYAFGLPAQRHGAVIVDFATSAVATGKLRFYRASGMPVPLGWILDREGRPTTDAADFFAGGMQLPAGGAKGYGLSVLAELIGESLLGAPREFNWLVMALDLAVFRPLAQFLASADDFLDELKAVPPADGFAEVMIPGEPERRSEAERQRSGIPIPEEIWRSIAAAARSVNLDADQLLSRAQP
jgi:LDH2 family malate/lactate/ureidoglycolate dehydrogenase